MRVALLTREFPPEVYGGAGVYVEYLARELASMVQLEVHAFGKQRPPEVARSYEPRSGRLADSPYRGVLEAMSVDLDMADAIDADIVHSNTWYTNFAGHLAKLLHGIPHVATSHSLEPLRPWKREQLGGGYELSCFVEKISLEAADAVIAVSEQMRADVLSTYPQISPGRVVVIHNGIDTKEYRPVDPSSALRRFGLDAGRPVVLFVGRVTRQKGITYLLRAVPMIDDGAQIVMCAGAADTPELAAEVSALLQDAKRGADVTWIDEMLAREDLVGLLSAATVFVCPSIYEPFGLVNVEAMACETAVVASAVGGIPEVVVEGETGYLVPFDPGDDAYGSPRSAGSFAAALAERINGLLRDPELAARMGLAGRLRAIEHFSWTSVAERTAALYERVVAEAQAR